MLFRTSRKDLGQLKADLGVCFAFEGDRQPEGVAEVGLRRELSAAMKAARFAGDAGESVVWNVAGHGGCHRYLVLGLGRREGSPGTSIRLGASRAVREAARYSASTVAIRLPGSNGNDPGDEVRAALEGASAGAYRFHRYLHDSDRRGVEIRSIEISADATPSVMKKALERGRTVSEAVSLARDLVNEPPSRMTPTAFVKAARRQATEHGLRCKVLGERELKALGTHALLAVSRGSSEPPRVVHLTYRPSGPKPKRKIVLVGKGVTFDSGGLNLKPGDSMLSMKSDMAGAAAVLGAMTTLRDLGCSAEVHALLGLVENMTGASAYKPGDILDTYSGKTVEVGNTDAEGRLVLCDLLAYAADRLKPTHVVDVATLTGAVVVALGTMATGLFTRDDSLRDRLLAAGASAGEKLWPLPLYDEYLKLIQRGPADLHNIGGRWGGAITAALFLGEFVPRSMSWAHLDIAGPAFNETESNGLPPGGTGAAVPTLARWLESL